MATYNWTGTGGNDLWSNLNNWNPNNGPPGEADTADIAPDNFSVVVNGISGVGNLELGFFFLGSPAGSTVTVDNGAVLDVAGSSNVFRASTLQSEPGGTISLLFNGTLTNSGTILVGQDLNAAGGTGSLDIDGAVTLSGSGTLELGEVTANPFGLTSSGTIANDPNTSDTLINQGNTISGAGSIALGTFDNQAGGTVEAGLSGAGALAITAGTFSNEGTMIAQTGATLNLGQDNASASLTNTGKITIDDNGTLAIAGSYTISGDGGILLASGGTGKIVSDRSPAELELTDQTLKGAGTIGDGILTLVNTGGTIAADVPNTGDSAQNLILNTGSSSIINGGTLAGINAGELYIGSPVANSGTIEAIGGLVWIAAAVSAPIFPPGQHSTIDIGTDGAIRLTASVAGNVTFTGGSAWLLADGNLANGGIGGDVLGAMTSDIIQFDGLSSSTSTTQQVSWQQNGNSGTLSLVENGATVASINLAGQYTSSDFEPLGNSEVGLVNPRPPPDTATDMIMEDGGNGDFEIYDLGSNAVLSGAALGQPIAFNSVEAGEDGAVGGPSWQAVGLGDFGLGQETTDMMLRNSSTGAFEIWDIADNNIFASAAIGQVGLEWTVAGFGDFSGNTNETDMLMRNSNTGAFEIYDLANNANAIYNAAPMGQVGLEWSVAGFGDFSGNANETDMLMRNNNTGAFEIYDISNNQLTSAGPMGQVGLEWSVAGFGDFSGNANETDMLMRNVNTGAFEIYDISNNQLISAAPMGQVGLEWSVTGFGDLSGNANETDMLMRNVNTGAFEYYDITGSQLGSAGSMGQVGLAWSVAGIAADPPGGAPSQLAQSMASYAPGSGVIDQTAPPTQTAVQTTAALAAQS